MMPRPRNKKLKKIKSRLYIYSEGTKTEINYLNGYIEEHHSMSNQLEFVEVMDVKQNTPKSLVERIIKDQSSHLDSDTYWVSYDREAVNKYTDKLHQEAISLANKNNINIALSNVCIELWILLHMINVTAPYRSCDDIVRNSALKAELAKRQINNYDKADDQLYAAISSNNGVENARKRAVRLNMTTLQAAPRNCKEPYKLNPYTDFYKVLDAIDDFLEKAKE